MEITLADQVSTSVARKGLEEQKIEGQNLLKLLDSAAPDAAAFRDPALGQRIDVRA